MKCPKCNHEFEIPEEIVKAILNEGKRRFIDESKEFLEQVLNDLKLSPKAEEERQRILKIIEYIEGKKVED